MKWKTTVTESLEHRANSLPKTEIVTRAGEKPPLPWGAAADVISRSAFLGYEIIDVLGRGVAFVHIEAEADQIRRVLDLMAQGLEHRPEDTPLPELGKDE